MPPAAVMILRVLAEAAAIAAYVHALVGWLAEGHEALATPDRWRIEHNRFAAARRGLDASFSDLETGARRPLRAILRAPLKTEVVAPRPRPDPIAELIAPPQRVIAVQRALNDYGYGPLKMTGQFGAETVSAIQKFERDRKLPVTGQISPRLLRELAALTGRPLE